MVQVVTPHAVAEVQPWAYNISAEQSVLGGLLLDNSAWENIADLVREEHFFVASHRLLFRSISGLIEANKGADPLTVAEVLERSGKLAEVGGMVAVGELALNTPSAANIRRYAEIVVERSTFRELYAQCQAVMEAVRQPGARSAREILDQAQARLMSMGERSAARAEFQDCSGLMREVTSFVDEQHEKYKHLADGAPVVTGLSTGLRDLDRATSGMQPTDLIVVAARPGMGKSALALNFAEHAGTLGVASLFFSLEMSNKQQGVRLVASRSGLNTQRLFSGRVADREWPRVVDAAGQISALPILFNDSPYLTVQEMRGLARRAKRQHPTLGLIVVDYLQLMVAGTSESNRANQIAEISRGLKLLAKELQVPVVALAQLNRELEKRTNKRPVLSDLRDSGAIEQDADMVLFIYREEVYHPNNIDQRGIAELIIAKQRNGPVGTQYARFQADNTRFVDFEGRAG